MYIMFVKLRFCVVPCANQTEFGPNVTISVYLFGYYLFTGCFDTFMYWIYLKSVT